MDRRRAAWRAWAASAFLAGCASGPAPDDAPGNCTIDPPRESLSCTQEYNPVCGCDGNTYPNACAARAHGVSEMVAGACGAPSLD